MNTSLVMMPFTQLMNNPDIDMDYMNDLISTFSIADVVERHSK